MKEEQWEVVNAQLNELAKTLQTCMSLFNAINDNLVDHYQDGIYIQQLEAELEDQRAVLTKLPNPLTVADEQKLEKFLDDFPD